MELTDLQGPKRFRNDDDDEPGRAAGADALALRPWYPLPSTASRICRVSRASGGKDRHSKVLTAKGLRDRRVRLSVSTAIQFYDLQDRLGYDQPSKAVEWLIKAAATAIAGLPSLGAAFSTEFTPDNDEKIANEELGQQQEHLSLTKSACSSTSETSRGSVLSLSRSEIRIKARERARERAKKEKDKQGEEEEEERDGQLGGSFIELLTGQDLVSRELRQVPASSSSIVTADYFSQGGQQGSFVGDQSQFSFLPEQLIPLAVPAGGDCINFSISSGVAGFHRGTLQSNFPPQQPLNHIQRLSSVVGGTNFPFFLGAAPAGWEGQLNSGFDSRLQLYYDGYPQLDLKGKDKN